jgi:outer membrane receptor protein involved in Fe transport
VGTKAGVSYMADNGLTLSLFDIYQGSPNSRYQNTINTVPKEHNVLNLHGALDINRALSAQFKPNVTLLLQVNNLLDDKYYIPEWGGTVHDAVPGSIGRTIYGGASLAL